MKKLLIGLCALCALAVSAAENPMNTVRTTKNVEELPAVLQAASAEITLQSPENRRVDLCVAYGLAYLRSTDAPTFDAYIKVVQDKAVEVYYKAVEAEGMSAADAAAQFQIIWPLQVKSFKNAEDRAAAKFRLQTLVDQYNNKLYTDTSVKPENSPWRAALTLWTANAK